MTHSKRIKRNVNTHYTLTSPEEIVILNIQNHRFYQLNHSAVDLWLALESPKTISHLLETLKHKYGKEQDYIKDVEEWLDSMQALALIDILQA